MTNFGTMTYDSDSRLPAPTGVLVAETVRTEWFGRKTFYRAFVLVAQHHPDLGTIFVKKPIIDSDEYVTVWGDSDRAAVEALLAKYLDGLNDRDRDPSEKWTRLGKQDYAWVAPELTEAEQADLDEAHGVCGVSVGDWQTRRAEAGYGE